MSDRDNALVLTGGGLTPAAVTAVARRGRKVEIDPGALARMAEARAVVERHLDEGQPVYGLSTGLGANVTHALPREALEEFSRLTLRGRSNSVGPPLPAEAVRATMTVRLNNLLTGASGASPAIAENFADLLNAGLHPVMPSIGSIGASDLCLMAHLGLALIGEGEIDADGEKLPAQEALARAGLKPAELGPKDGLVICNSSSVSVGLGALALHDANDAYNLANIAAALSLEGFRGNLTPFDPRVAPVRPQPGQAEAAGDLLGLFAGGSLLEPGAARRLQDPISLRCTAQVHGALKACLDFAGPALDADLNGESTNPVVLLGDGEILSTGNFHAPLLAIALDTLARALTQVAILSASRTARLLMAQLSGLPAYLSPRGPGRSGFAPLLKTAEALMAEIEHFATPVRGGLSLAIGGVEDHMTHAPQAAQKLTELLWRFRLVIAIELLVAAQAVDLRGIDRLGRGTARAQAAVRDIVPPLDDDRPLGADVERIAAELLATGRLLEIVHKTL